MIQVASAAGVFLPFGTPGPLTAGGPPFHRTLSPRVFRWRPGMPNLIPADTRAKTPTEARYFVFDFSGFPELAGSASLLKSPAPVIRGGAGLTVGVPAVTAVTWDGIPAGKAVVARIAGGADQLTARLSCVAYAAADVQIEVPGRVAVAEVV